jgi:hypothetical protein
MPAATPTPKSSRRLLPVDPYFAIMLAVTALGQSSLSPVALYFTVVRGPLHERHWAEICFNLMMSKPKPLTCNTLNLTAISWTGVAIGIWWITAFVGLSDLYVKGNIGFGILDRRVWPSD